jgi:myo-inositol-1(or 4)-monophosphatase
MISENSLSHSDFLAQKSKCEQLVCLAEESVKNAAAFLNNDLIDPYKVISEKEKDIKLNADIEVSQFIIERISQQSNYKCLSEENAAHITPTDHEPYWVIDPIDGSMNFLQNIPFFCISVALWYQNKPLIGVVYELTNNVCYCSFNGRTVANREPICVGDVQSIEKAILATGIPLLSDVSTAAIHDFARCIKYFKKIRMLGSAALSLAWVAQGRLDVYYERDIMLWDIAAGVSLVEGAGGFYVIKEGRYPFSVDVVAGNRTVVEEMCEILNWKNLWIHREMNP